MVCAKSALITTAIAGVASRSGAHADRAAVAEQDLLDRLAGLDPDALVARDAGHRLHHRAAAAARVEHAVLVLEEREDREQARALERRHAEVLALEREAEAHARVAEVAREVAVDAAQRPQPAQGSQDRRREQRAGARERHLQDRLEGAQLGPVVGAHRRQPPRVLRAQLRDLRHHPVQIRAGEQAAARLEHEAVHRLQPDQIDLLAERTPTGGEDLLEDARVEEEGRAAIEPEAVDLEVGRAPADPGLTLQHGDLGARPRQQHGDGEAAGPRAHDHNPVLRQPDPPERLGNSR